MNYPNEHDLIGLWRSQGSLAQPQQLMSIQELQAAAYKLRRSVRRRNSIEYIAGFFVILGFASSAASASYWMERVGALMVIIGCLVTLWQLHLRGSALPASQTEAGAQGTRQAFKQDLLRQHHALSTVASWYLAPFVPGLLVFHLATSLQAAGRDWARLDGWGLALKVLSLFLVFGLILWLNLRTARKLKVEIAALDKEAC